jgi:hypothetical protein
MGQSRWFAPFHTARRSLASVCRAASYGAID